MISYKSDKKGNFLNFFYYLILIVSSLFLIAPIFKKGIPMLLDNPKHLSETIYLTKYLIPQRHWINGWCMADFAGFPILLYHYILGKSIAAFLSISTGINIIIAYKLLMAVAIVFPTVSLFFLFSRISSKTASLITALFFLLQTTHILKIAQGMWNNYLALGFLPLFIYALLKVYTDNSLKYCGVAVLLFSLTIISHQYVAIAESFFALFFFFISLFSKKTNSFRFFLKLSLIAILSISLASFYIYPFIEAGKWLSANKMFGKGIIEPWASLYHQVKIFLNVPENISLSKQLFNNNGELFFKNLFSKPFIKLSMLLLDFFAITGLIVSFKKEEYKHILNKGMIFFTFFFLIFSSDLWRSVNFLNNLPFAGGIENNRFMLFSQIGLLFFCIYGLDYFFHITQRKDFILKIICLVIIAGGLITFSSHLKNKKFLITSNHLEDYRQIESFWEWTSKNLNPNKERLLIQRTKGNIAGTIFNESHILSLTWYYSGVNHIGAWNSGFPYTTEKIVSTEGGRIMGMSMKNIDDRKLARRMKIFNTSHIAAVSQSLQNFLERSPSFQKIADFGLIEVFKLLNYKPLWIDFIKGKGKVGYINLANEMIEAKIVTEEFYNTIRIKVQNHPYWKCEINGEETKLSTDE
ncbi:MAG: hypothetical protein D6734_04450, partial [Candidatus Schekmanbacteria bacterium]